MASGNTGVKINFASGGNRILQDSSKEFQEILKSIFSHLEEIEKASTATLPNRLADIEFDRLHRHLSELQENVHMFQNLSMSGIQGRESDSFKPGLQLNFV